MIKGQASLVDLSHKKWVGNGTLAIGFFSQISAFLSIWKLETSFLPKRPLLLQIMVILLWQIIN